jgi:aspartate carbamoyltransferase catalytic subunit
MPKRDILGLYGVGRDVIGDILCRSAFMKPIVLAAKKGGNQLRGKSIVTLFYENSTRTRMSFELAAKYLGGIAANITASGSSVEKGETLIDTGITLDVMGVDVIIMRHPMSGAPHLLAKHVKASVINAGDGMNEHPTQALLDLFTIQEHYGRIEGLKIAIIGDVLHSRVARSNIYGMVTMGANVFVAGPSTLMPQGLESLGVTAGTNVEAALKGADVVMGLRIQKERQQAGLFPSVREYASYFGISADRLKLANPGALVMHPGPVNRGVEMSSYVIDGPTSVINTQVQNGVAVRMALLDMLAGEAEGKGEIE